MLTPVHRAIETVEAKTFAHSKSLIMRTCHGIVHDRYSHNNDCAIFSINIITIKAMIFDLASLIRMNVVKQKRAFVLNSQTICYPGSKALHGFQPFSIHAEYSGNIYSKCEEFYQMLGIELSLYMYVAIQSCSKVDNTHTHNIFT